MMTTLATTVLTLIACSTLALFTHRITLRTYQGILAIANTLLAAGWAHRGSPLIAGVFAGLAALQAWLWWNGGGCNGTRRRLKTLRRRFVGTRRTPAHAA
jgi:hypothetical protein